MKKIGLTGGIGSGKSMVGRILEAMNYPVFYSDIRSKELSNTDPEIRENLIRLVGTDVYLNGEINRPFLANKIFNNDSLREQVNAIIHPRVREYFQQWANNQDAPFVFNEAAILFETGAYKSMDLNVLVTAPEELKIKRVMDRDHVSHQQVIERMTKQMDDSTKLPLADFVLINDERTPLLAQIESLLDGLAQN